MPTVCRQRNIPHFGIEDWSDIGAMSDEHRRNISRNNNNIKTILNVRREYSYDIPMSICDITTISFRHSWALGHSSNNESTE